MSPDLKHINETLISSYFSKLTDIVTVFSLWQAQFNFNARFSSIITTISAEILTEIVLLNLCSRRSARARVTRTRESRHARLISLARSGIIERLLGRQLFVTRLHIVHILWYLLFYHRFCSKQNVPQINECLKMLNTSLRKRTNTRNVRGL